MRDDDTDEDDEDDDTDDDDDDDRHKTRDRGQRMGTLLQCQRIIDMLAIWMEAAAAAIEVKNDQGEEGGKPGWAQTVGGHQGHLQTAVSPGVSCLWSCG